MTVAHLYAGADPSGAGVGFFTPVFRRADLNQLCIQVTAAAEGSITAFAPIEQNLEPLIMLDERPVKTGDPVVWIFAFDRRDTIIGQGDQGKSELRSRLESEFFQKRPMLGLEAAEFLGADSPRQAFARAAFLRFAKASPSAAGVWRDLSILTPDTVARLRQLPQQLLLRAAPDLGRVTVSTNGERIIVTGIDGHSHAADIGPILEQIEGAYRSLKDLYVDIWSPNPQIVFAKSLKQRAPDQARARSVNSVVLILDPKLRWLRDSLVHRPGSWLTALMLDEIAALDRLAPGREFYTLAPLSMPMGHLPVGEVHIALRPAGPKAPRAEDLEDLPRPSVVLDAPRVMNGMLGGGSVAKAVGDVISALGALDDQEAQWSRPEVQLFVQGSGAGPNPTLDGWCQAYSKLARLGALGAPGNRFHTASADQHSDLEHVLEAMFPELLPIVLPSQGWTQRAGACAVLASGVHRLNDGAAQAIHTHAILKVLNHLDIDVRESRLGPYEIHGPGRAHELSMRLSEPLDTPSTLVGDSPLVAAPFRAERIVAIEDAHPRDIVYRLISHHEFLVSIRDLALMSPATPPLERIVAAQMRRFAGNLPSAAKTSYYSMATNAVLDASHQDDEAIKYVRQLIQPNALAIRFNLLCSRVIFDGDHAVADIRAVTRERGLSPTSPILEYKLVFGPSGSKVTGVARLGDDGRPSYIF